jgi:hypothetical protein
MSKLRGLLLHHGKPQPAVFREMAKRAKAKQFATLIISTQAVAQPEDIEPSAYLYLYSIGVRNFPDDTDSLAPLFQKLVDRFRDLVELPDENAIRALWESVDPVSDAFERIRLLEKVLVSESDSTDEIAQDFKTLLQPFFPGVSRYADLKNAYLQLCQSSDIKKKRTAGI